MKLFILAAFALLVVFGTGAVANLYDAVSTRTQTASTFINDSNIINIPDDTLPDAIVPDDDSGSGGGGGSTPPPGGDDEVLVFGDSEGDSGGDTINQVVVNSGGSNDNSGDGGSGGSNSGSSNNNNGSGDGETVSTESILDSLTGNQAISSSSGGGAASGGGTSVSGSKTREALLSRGITTISVPPIPEAGSVESSARAPYTRNDLAIIVSAALVQNPDIDDIFFTTTALEISYKSRGRLLFTIPVPYPTKVSLSFDETTTKKRVKVKFPWYKFFMWTGVSKNSLRNSIDPIITSTPKGEEYDRATHIFNAVSEVIASARGTIQGSLSAVQ